ncbi:hypothetical protein ACN2EN_02060 [Aliarcobacter lanthieri]|nr:hypothetical protein [Aliarcobacter lanthieri]
MNNSKVLNSVFIVRVSSYQGLVLGVKTFLNDHIDEEFEEDDDQNWIKL